MDKTINCSYVAVSHVAAFSFKIYFVSCSTAITAAIMTQTARQRALAAGSSKCGGEEQRPSDERKVSGRNKRSKRGKWIFRRSVIAVSPGVRALERERENERI